jgi:hypothetical protein
MLGLHKTTVIITITPMGAGHDYGCIADCTSEARYSVTIGPRSWPSYACHEHLHDIAGHEVVNRLRNGPQS